MDERRYELPYDENVTWKVAFGFDKGKVQQVKTGGKKLTEHHQAIAAKLFPDDISGRWTADSDMKKLGLAALVRCLERKNFLLSTKESPYKY